MHSIATPAQEARLSGDRAATPFAPFRLRGSIQGITAIEGDKKETEAPRLGRLRSSRASRDQPALAEPLADALALTDTSIWTDAFA